MVCVAVNVLAPRATPPVRRRRRKPQSNDVIRGRGGRRIREHRNVGRARRTDSRGDSRSDVDLDQLIGDVKCDAVVS